MSMRQMSEVGAENIDDHGVDYEWLAHKAASTFEYRRLASQLPQRASSRATSARRESPPLHARMLRPLRHHHVRPTAQMP